MEEKKISQPAVPSENEEEALIEQAKIRREKLQKLQAEGKNPYEKVKYEVNADSEGIKKNFEAYEGKTVSLAGQNDVPPHHGKASFRYF